MDHPRNMLALVLAGSLTLPLLSQTTIEPNGSLTYWACVSPPPSESVGVSWSSAVSPYSGAHEHHDSYRPQWLDITLRRSLDRLERTCRGHIHSGRPTACRRL